MATTTNNSSKATKAITTDSQSLPILQIADADEVQRALEIMFEAYVYQCTWRDESDHHTVCGVYYGFISLLREHNKATS